MPRKVQSADSAVAKLLPPELTLLTSTSIATLWSSYGQIYRISAIPSDDGHAGSAPRSLILKHIHPPPTSHASLSHARKLTSYAVERYFYAQLAPRLSENVSVAKSYPTTQPGTLLLDDLSTSFPSPAWGSLGRDDTKAVLRWLAGFHAAFWGGRGTVPSPVAGEAADVGAEASGVWEQGTYYYLDTRREEMSQVNEDDESGWVVRWADKVDNALKAERDAGRSTLLHGDAKGANILFSPSRTCAFVDFQYVGGGVPALDLVYFLGTSVQSQLLRGEGEKELLQFYWDELQANFTSREQPTTYTRGDFDRQWELAIVDWYRFMAGWGFWGNDGWVAQRARQISQKWEVDGFN